MSLDVVLAIVISIGVLLQIVVRFLLYRVIKRLADRAEHLVAVIEPEITDLAVGMRAVRHAVEVSTAEVQATLAGVRAATEELTEMARSEGREFARVGSKARDAAEHQIEQFSQSVDQARERITEIGVGFDRTVLDPVRTILAVAYGVRRAMQSFVSPKRDRVEPPADAWADPVDG